MLDILRSGAVVNFLLVIIGGVLGCFLKKGIPEKAKNILMQGMALCVFYIGVTGIFEDNINVLIVIISVGLGALIGELLDLDRLVNKLGENLEKKINKPVFLLGDEPSMEMLYNTTIDFFTNAQ